MKLVRTIQWTWTVVPAALLVSAVAAGQPGDSGGSFPTPNPCSLLSSAEIGAVAGVAVGQGAIPFRNERTAGCSFVRPGGGRIAVLIRPLLSGEWAVEQVDRMRRGVGFGSYRAIGAVGERAFLLDMKAAGAVLCVFRNPYYLQISIAGAGDDAQKSTVFEKLVGIALRQLSSTSTQPRAAAHAARLPVDSADER